VVIRFSPLEKNAVPFSLEEALERAYNLAVSDIEAHADALLEFHDGFADFFRSATRSVAPHARDYLQGQLLCESRRNMNQMAVQVVERNPQALSNFISTSPWADAPLLAAIGQQAAERLSASAAGSARALLLDESGIAKQGTASVGVARQYCGALGKVDNCQVGVYLAYSTDHEATLIDRRLYLPQKWVDDPARCTKAGIPAQAQVFRTKAELGLAMIQAARGQGLAFDFVGMDAHYGEQPWLLSQLEDEGLTYVADIPSNTRVYVEAPTVGVPPRQGPRGRTPSKPRVLDGEAVEVRHLVTEEALPWQVLPVRDSQRGQLWIRCATVCVWRIEDGLPAQPVWLIIRQALDGSETKYSFSNAETDQPRRLAQWQARRYWVERALQDGKGLAGLDEYQVLGWRGWHHHMTMVLLAMLFLLQLKHTLRPQAPMLTLQDVHEILRVVMPRKTLSFEEVVELIRQKHLNRWRSRNSYLKKQNEQRDENRFLI
jgi:SRSO17 transposase